MAWTGFLFLVMGTFGKLLCTGLYNMHEISLLAQEILCSQEGAWCREFLSFLILVVAYSMKFKINNLKLW